MVERVARVRVSRALAVVALAVVGAAGLVACEPPVHVIDVTSTRDLGDQVPGDGRCLASDGGCTLRAAVDEANALEGLDEIRLAAGARYELVKDGRDDDNRYGDLDVSDDLIVTGNGATIDANARDRIFDVRFASLTLNRVTLTGGLSLGEDQSDTNSGGGAIRATDFVPEPDAVLWINDSVIVDNAAATVGSFGATSFGGGVLAVGLAAVHVNRTTISDNRLDAGESYGGGIASLGTPLQITDSVIEGNAGGVYANSTLHLTRSQVLDNELGGGVFGSSAVITDSLIRGNSFASSDTEANPVAGVSASSLTLSRSTVVDNDTGGVAADEIDVLTSATITNSTIGGRTSGVAVSTTYNGGSIDIADSTVTSTGGFLFGANVRVSGSALRGECSGPVASGGYNAATKRSCGLDQPGDREGIRINLGPLADNGGPTPTMRPSAASPLRDAIPAGTAGLCDSSITTDQRGEPRPLGDACDIGAVES